MPPSPGGRYVFRDCQKNKWSPATRDGRDWPVCRASYSYVPERGVHAASISDSPTSLWTFRRPCASERRCGLKPALRGAMGPGGPLHPSPFPPEGRRGRRRRLRARLKIRKGPATRDFVRGRGGETGASPQRAVTVEPTKASRKRPVARRVFAGKAAWLRCSSVTDP